MSLRMAFLALVLLSLSLPGTAMAAPTVDPAQPLAAGAVLSETGIDLRWVPGVAPADYFEIYGVANGNMEPLGFATADQSSAQVPEGFSEYAVTAWHDGTESPAARAMADVSEPCLSVYQGIPPTVAVGTSCILSKTLIQSERPA